jgi:aryl-alcohol dehydrogenase-like predicted oxidoreductase
MDNKETLEEAAENYSLDKGEQLDFIVGAKWQQERSYSEEDMKKAFEDGQENMDYSEMYGWSSKLTTEEWFEQFKKK